MKTITLFKDGDGQWACRFNFRENIDIDIVVTELSKEYITTLNVARAEYRDGLVMCNALDQYDVYVKAEENTGAAGLINRSCIKLSTSGKPKVLKMYKFEFGLVYEGS